MMGCCYNGLFDRNGGEQLSYRSLYPHQHQDSLDYIVLWLLRSISDEKVQYKRHWRERLVSG